MISAVSTSSLPVINGNSLFWAMAALIAAEAAAIMKLAGALYRSRHVQAVIPGDEPGYARAVARRQDDAPEPLVRRRRSGRGGRGGRLLIGAAVVAVVLWAADKVAHFKIPSAVPGAAASPTARPSLKVTATPHPGPSVSSSPSRAPVTAAHAASHFPLTGTEIVIIAIVAVLGLVAYGINRVRAREM